MQERLPGHEDDAPEPPPPILSERAKRWIEENREAIASYNRWIEEHGLPLAEYREF